MKRYGSRLVAASALHRSSERRPSLSADMPARTRNRVSCTGMRGMPQTETLLTALLHGLLLEGRVPPGSVIDAGAFDGQTACEYASVAPLRGACTRWIRRPATWRS